MRDDWLEPLGFEDTPDTVKGISADLRAVEPMLQNLKNTLQDDSSQIIPCDQIKHAVENCDRACVAFQSRIEHWMKHSTEDKIFWLSDCKGTLSVALSTSTIIITSRQENLMKEMKDMMLRQNKATMKQRVEHSLQQLTVSGSSKLNARSKQSGESEQSRQELLQELGRQQAANTAFKEMFEEALSRTVYERTGQKIKGVKATNNSSALAGFINKSGEELKIDQDISDVTADNWSVAVARVIKNVDLKDLRPGWPGGSGRDDVRRES
ncbi:hypothetical protein V2W45_1522116 [Cenococcum geophilum]